MWPAVQNLGALAVIFGLAYIDKIRGDMALVAILAVLGVIALPSLKRQPPGTLGVITLAAIPIERALHMVLRLLV